MTRYTTRPTRPNRRRRDYSPLVGWIGVVLVSLAVWGVLIAAVWPSPEPNDGTDTGVGCLDDCLEPMDPAEKRIDAEPIRHDQEEA